MTEVSTNNAFIRNFTGTHTVKYIFWLQYQLQLILPRTFLIGNISLTNVMLLQLHIKAKYKVILDNT